MKRYVVEEASGKVGVIDVKDGVVVSYGDSREQSEAQAVMLNQASNVPRCRSCGEVALFDKSGSFCDDCEQRLEDAR